MRYRSDELLYRVVAAHSSDDEVRLAWDVDRSRRVLHHAPRVGDGSHAAVEDGMPVGWKSDFALPPRMHSRWRRPDRMQGYGSGPSRIDDGVHVKNGWKDVTDPRPLWQGFSKCFSNDFYKSPANSS
jgi:hypothetical protein